VLGRIKNESDAEISGKVLECCRDFERFIQGDIQQACAVVLARLLGILAIDDLPISLYRVLRWMPIRAVPIFLKIVAEENILLWLRVNNQCEEHAIDEKQEGYFHGTQGIKRGK